MSSNGHDGIMPAFALAFADGPADARAWAPRAPVAVYATRSDAPPPGEVTPALEHAVWVERGDERPAPPVGDAGGGDGGDSQRTDPDGLRPPVTYARPLAPELVNALARRFGVPAWLGGTRAEADLVEAHQCTSDVAAEFKALSAGALSLRSTVRRIQHNVLAARFVPVDALPVAVVLLSPQRVVSANAALARLLGRDRAAIEGAPWRDILGDDAAPLAALFPVADGGSVPPTEPGRAALTLRVRVPSLDGAARFYAVEAAPALHGLAYCVVRPDDTPAADPPRAPAASTPSHGVPTV